jgi:hypothetical protein
MLINKVNISSLCRTSELLFSSTVRLKLFPQHSTAIDGKPAAATPTATDPFTEQLNRKAEEDLQKLERQTSVAPNAEADDDYVDVCSALCATLFLSCHTLHVHERYTSSWPGPDGAAKHQRYNCNACTLHI